MRSLIERFLKKIERILDEFEPTTLLEAGCGEGFVISRLKADLKVGLDINCEAVEWAKAHWGGTYFLCGDVFHLPFEDSSFDLVLSLEVMEHLEDPGPAVDEIKRVARRGVVISVPHEPYFRLGSFLRGKYLKTLGNHPEHIQQFTGRRFQRFMEENFSRFRIERSFPWLIGVGYL